MCKATGFRGAVPPWDSRTIIPAYADFMWIGGFAIITIVVVGRALMSPVRAGTAN